MQMRGWIVLILICLVVGLAVVWWYSQNGPLDQVKRYRIYYGPMTSDILEAMKSFDMVILEPKQLRDGDVTALHDAGVIVIGYMSVIEIGSWDEEWMSQTEPYWIHTDGQVLKNGENPLGNIIQSEYRSLLLDYHKRWIVDRGLDGVFLDTVDTMTLYDDQWAADAHAAYYDLLSALRSNAPAHYVIQNRGFDVLYGLPRKILDAVMWENFRPEDIADQDTRPLRAELEWSRRWRRHSIFAVTYSNDPAVLAYTKKRNWILLIRADGTSHIRWIEE